METTFFVLAVIAVLLAFAWGDRGLVAEERRHGAELERIKAQADAALKTKAR